MYLIAFPLLLVPFALYNMIAFLLDLSFSDTLFNIPLASRRTLPVSSGDFLVLLGVLLLYVEFLKVARLRRKLIADHVLSLLLLGAMGFELVALPKAATSPFLALLALSLVDVIGGFSLAGRRDFAADEPDRMPAASRD
jgi:hypothetical protein